MVVSVIPVYLLCLEKGISKWQSYVLSLSYLLFYGVQFALWFDVHSAVFGAGFLMWFIYFTEKRVYRWSVLTFFAVLLSKENFSALLASTCVVFLYYSVKNSGWNDTFSRYMIALITLSLVYFSLIFFAYYPHFTQRGYAFQSHDGLFSSFNPLYLADTNEKREVLFVSLAWFGFIALGMPIYLFPVLLDLAIYFVIGHHLGAAQGLFMHYRVTLAPLLVWPVIHSLHRFVYLRKTRVTVYLLICMLLGQYFLHLPLSYLTKSWFWRTPAAVHSINAVMRKIPPQASVVAQNNILPHLSHRDEIFTLWTKEGQLEWGGHPEYLIVDTSAEWDIRHLLANREDFIAALATLERSGRVQVVERNNTTVLYRISKR